MTHLKAALERRAAADQASYHEPPGVPTTVPLLVGFLAACLVQLVGAGLLIWLRPSGFIVMPAGMLLSAIFWWGFDLPLAWLGAARISRSWPRRGRYTQELHASWFNAPIEFLTVTSTRRQPAGRALGLP